MNFKRYLDKIKKKTEKIQPKIEAETIVTEDTVTDQEIQPEAKKILRFVDPNKDPRDYLKRYIKESKYKNWFHRNYPDHTIYEAVGLTASDYVKIKREVLPEPKQVISNKKPKEKNRSNKEINSKITLQQEHKTTFDDFVDERLLVSSNAFGNKEMKIKIIEVSDETAHAAWKFGDRVKVNKILVTIKHLETQQIEEREFDIEEIERELREKRHYASSNRWTPTNDIKNGFIIKTRHTSLISDAAALDYILF